MSKARVLVVDDDLDFAESLAEVLEDKGHQVVIVHSGEEAVEVFRAQNFDITLMDMKLPGMNGVESYVEFRKLRPETKVVMMTGYSVEDLIRQAQDEGVLAVFNKPVDIDKLMDFVDHANPNGGDILLVDDDEDFVQSTEEFLQEKGYSVAIAHSGQEALEKIKDGNIKTLLLDLRMPVMSGLEVYLELKKQNQLIPTIIMTAYRETAKESKDALKLQDSCYLFKPFDPEKLTQLLESIMDKDK